MRAQAFRLSISRKTRRGSLSHSIWTLSRGRNCFRTCPSSVRTTSPLTPPERTFISPNLTAGGDFPLPLDLAAAAVPDLVVHVDRRAHVAWHHPRLLADPGGRLDLDEAVLLVQPGHRPPRPVDDEPVRARVLRRVVREGLPPAVDDALPRHGRADHRHQDAQGAILEPAALP